MIKIEGNTITGDDKKGIQWRESDSAQGIVIISNWAIINFTLLREAAWPILRAVLSAIFTGHQPISLNVLANKIMVNGKRITGPTTIKIGESADEEHTDE